MEDLGDRPIHVFISHRHVDEQLADVFREELSRWCPNGASVFQSSNAQTSSRIGTRLDETIRNAIRSSNLVVLIWTDAPGDYDWCMYECGLAQSLVEGKSSNIIVFHTTPELPDPFEGRVGLRLDEESVERFTFDFHRSHGFFANHSGALRPDIDDSDLATRASRLHARLTEAAPRAPHDTPVYDRITLALPRNVVDEILTASTNGGVREAEAVAGRRLAESATIRSCCGDPQEHFAFDLRTEGMTLAQLLERWHLDVDPELRTHWVEELYSSIVAAILNRPERELSTPFVSLHSGQWLLPVLARFRELPYLEEVEFDVLFCRLDTSAARRMAGLE